MFLLFNILYNAKKDGTTSVKGYATQSYVQLRKVERMINKLENANFVKKYFNRECISLLKEQKKFIEKAIKKQEELGILKEDSKFSKPVENIVKENTRLSKEITKSNDITYTSKREMNRWNQIKRRWRPRKNVNG